MNKNFETLTELTKAEFYQFADLVNSPFYNKRSDMVKLMEYLCSIYPKLNEESLEEEVIYRRVYSDAKKDFSNNAKQVTRNLLTRLGELLEKYLIVTGLERDKDYKLLPYAVRLKEKNRKGKLTELIETSITSLYEIKGQVDYHKKYTEYLEAKEMFISDSGNYAAKSQTLTQLMETSFSYYVLSLLKNANELAAFLYVHKNRDAEFIMEKVFSIVNMEKHLEYLSSGEPSLYNITKIYYYGLLSKINDPDGTIREKLKETVYASFGSLRKIDLMECWSMLYASYIFSMTAIANHTNVNANMEVHKINMIFVDNELIPTDENGTIDENTYHNIAMQAIIVRDFVWAEEFLNNYKGLLREKVREFNYSMCMSQLLFNRGDYDKCITYLSRIKAAEINTDIFIRLTYIKCFYEIGFYEQAESALFAMRSFISQNKRLTYETKRMLPAFVKYCKQLLRMKATGKNVTPELYQKAQNETNLSSRKWLLEKMEELMAKS